MLHCYNVTFAESGHALHHREVISLARKLRLRGHEITGRWKSRELVLEIAIKREQAMPPHELCRAWAGSMANAVNWCWKLRVSESRVMLTSTLPSVSNFDEFFIKIAPNRCPKFGIWRKMLYLCRALGKCSASVGCGSAEFERARLCVRLAPPLHCPDKKAGGGCPM